MGFCSERGCGAYTEVGDVGDMGAVGSWEGSVGFILRRWLVLEVGDRLRGPETGADGADADICGWFGSLRPAGAVVSEDHKDTGITIPDELRKTVPDRPRKK